MVKGSMGKLKTLSLILFLCLSYNSFAKFNKSVSIVSDYVWRGVTQTNNKLALQASLEYEHDKNWLIGGWFSDVANLGGEIDLYGKYSFKISEQTNIFTGLTYYQYSNNYSNDTLEFFVGANLNGYTLVLNYTNN